MSLPVDFRFDPATHSYFRGTRRVPGVTEILDALDPGAYTNVPAFYRDRGTAVHLACEILNTGGEIAPDSLDAAIGGFVEAYRRFLREMRPDILESEVMVYDEEYDFAGRLDLRLRLGATWQGDARWVYTVDIKSGQPTRRVGVQTALYRQAHGFAAMADARAALWLKGDGSYRWMPDMDHPALFGPEDLEAGLAAREILRWRQGGKT